MDADSRILDQLARQLRDPRLPKQTAIAAAIGTDQGFISRVRNRDVKRVTNRVVKLHNYVNKVLDPWPLLMSEIEGYLDLGGDPQLLVKQVRILGAAQRLGGSDQ